MKQSVLRHSSFFPFVSLSGELALITCFMISFFICQFEISSIQVGGWQSKETASNLFLFFSIELTVTHRSVILEDGRFLKWWLIPAHLQTLDMLGTHESQTCEQRGCYPWIWGIRAFWMQLPTVWLLCCMRRPCTPFPCKAAVSQLSRASQVQQFPWQHYTFVLPSCALWIVCMCACMQWYICVHVYVCVYGCKCVHVYMQVCMCANICMNI